LGDVRDALKRLTPFAFDGDFRLKDSHAILDSSKSLRDLELHCGVGEYLELEYDHPNHFPGIFGGGGGTDKKRDLARQCDENEPRTGRSVDELLSALGSCAPEDEATRRNALDEISSRLSAVLDTNGQGPPTRRRRLREGAASADAPVPFDGAELGRLAEALLRYAGDDEENPSRCVLLDEARAGSRALTLSEIADEIDALRDDRASVTVSPDDARALLAESRGGLSEDAVCADATCIKNFEEATRLRCALVRVRDDVAPGINMRLPRIRCLTDVCRTTQMDAAHYGTEEGDHDYVQRGHGCITFKDDLVWSLARDGGTISNADYELLSREGAAQTLNQKPLAMPVTVGGTRPKPEKTYLGLCECVC